MTNTKVDMYDKFGKLIQPTTLLFVLAAFSALVPLPVELGAFAATIAM